jgi:hypothetical protein
MPNGIPFRRRAEQLNIGMVDLIVVDACHSPAAFCPLFEIGKKGVTKESGLDLVESAVQPKLHMGVVR